MEEFALAIFIYAIHLASATEDTKCFPYYECKTKDELPGLEWAFDNELNAPCLDEHVRAYFPKEDKNLVSFETLIFFKNI